MLRINLGEDRRRDRMFQKILSKIKKKKKKKKKKENNAA